MKPPFIPRTFAFPPEGTYPEKMALARRYWRAYYHKHPEAWKKRCDLEHATYENMVQQYVAINGFRPDNDKLEGWTYEEP